MRTSIHLLDILFVCINLSSDFPVVEVQKSGAAARDFVATLSGRVRIEAACIRGFAKERDNCFLRNGCQTCIGFNCTSDFFQEDIESLLACVGTLAA